MARSRIRHALLLGLLTVMYVAAGRLGLVLAFVNDSASAVWPPSGLAIAVLLLLGVGTWPVVAIGAFLVNLSTSGAIGASLLIAAGNTLEAVVGAWLTNRFAGGAAAFERTPTILRFTFLMTIFATTIAATVGVAALVASGLAAPADAGSIWFTWWLGDAVGAMLITPLLVLWSRASTLPRHPARSLEAAGLVICLAAVLAIAFGGPAGRAHYPLAFLLMPMLLWTAFRFGARETATAAAVVCVIAIAGTLRGLGPFARSSPNESLLVLQAFIGVTTIMMLSVAAEVKRRKTFEIEIQSLNEALERRIASRTEELRAVNERLLEAQHVAHVGSWEWDVGSNRLWWSEELYRMYGIGADEMAGYETYLGHVHPDDRERVDATVRKAMVDGQSFRFEHRIVRPDGGVRVLSAAGRVALGPDGRPARMMGVGHDITDRKRAEEERAQLIREQTIRREAEEASRAKDEFLAILSHELRTPLNAALGWSRILLGEPRADDPKTARAIDAIHRNLLLQARLVSDILDVSRITKGGLVLQLELADVRAVVAAAFEMVREAAVARRITIERHVQGDGFDITCDAPRLQQVTWNLLSNAVRFGRDNGYVRLTLSGEADGVAIVVADDGPGIDAAFLPYVFEPFRQADASPKRQHDGLGLGLSIARHIVVQHGGTITAANDERGGAVLTVRLPRGPVAGTAPE